VTPEQGRSGRFLWFSSKGDDLVPGMFLALASVCHDGFQVIVELRRLLLARLARHKDTAQALEQVRYIRPGLILRNCLTLVVARLHGFRRLAPPY
jgi:hypothetical protein